MGFWQWFWGEAGAAWIFGFLGLIGIIYTFLRRPRPPKIIVHQVETLKLLDIHPSMRENLEVIYTYSEGRKAPIKSLEQRKIVIYNNSTTDLKEPVELVLGLERGTDSAEWRFWHPFTEDSECSVKVLTPQSLTDKQMNLVIEIPYLNSHPVHKHFVELYLISDGPLTVNIARGLGKGWSSRLVTEEQHAQIERNAKATDSLVFLFLSALPIFLALWVTNLFDVSQSTITTVGVLSSIGALALTALTGRWWSSRITPSFYTLFGVQDIRRFKG